MTIANNSLGVQATEAVREAILCGHFKAGQYLTESDLADELGLARVTVRAALQQLATEGLVVQRPYRGCEVRSLSSQDIWELYTLRGALEALAARLAAQRVKTGVCVVEKLEQVFQELERVCHSGDDDMISQLDFELHKTIFDLSGHQLLKNHYHIIEQQVRLCIASSNALVPTGGEILEQHEPLVIAVRNGDAEEAERIALIHNFGEGEKLRKYAVADEEKGSR